MSRNFKQLCEAAGYDVRSYSGRGMYGKYCLGIETDDSTFEVAVNLTRQVFEDRDDPNQEEVELLELASRSFSQDSMGLGKIIYFPHIKWEESWGGIEDEESDYE